MRRGLVAARNLSETIHCKTRIWVDQTIKQATTSLRTPRTRQSPPCTSSSLLSNPEIQGIRIVIDGRPYVVHFDVKNWTVNRSDCPLHEVPSACGIPKAAPAETDDTAHGHQLMRRPPSLEGRAKGCLRQPLHPTALPHGAPSLSHVDHRNFHAHTVLPRVPTLR